MTRSTTRREPAVPAETAARAGKAAPAGAAGTAATASGAAPTPRILRRPGAATRSPGMPPPPASAGAAAPGRAAARAGPEAPEAPAARTECRRQRRRRGRRRQRLERHRRDSQLPRSRLTRLLRRGDQRCDVGQPVLLRAAPHELRGHRSVALVGLCLHARDRGGQADQPPADAATPSTGVLPHDRRSGSTRRRRDPIPCATTPRDQSAQPVAAGPPQVLGATVQFGTKRRLPLPAPDRRAIIAELLGHVYIGESFDEQADGALLPLVQVLRPVAVCCIPGAHASLPPFRALVHGSGTGRASATPCKQPSRFARGPSQAAAVRARGGHRKERPHRSEHRCRKRPSRRPSGPGSLARVSHAPRLLEVAQTARNEKPADKQAV